MGDGGSVVVVSAWHAYVGSTRASGIVSSPADVIGMRVVGGVCMCLVWGGEWIRRLCLGFTNPVGTVGVFAEMGIDL